MNNTNLFTNILNLVSTNQNSQYKGSKNNSFSTAFEDMLSSSMSDRTENLGTSSTSSTLSNYDFGNTLSSLSVKSKTEYTPAEKIDYSRDVADSSRDVADASRDEIKAPDRYSDIDKIDERDDVTKDDRESVESDNSPVEEALVQLGGEYFYGFDANNYTDNTDLAIDAIAGMGTDALIGAITGDVDSSYLDIIMGTDTTDSASTDMLDFLVNDNVDDNSYSSLLTDALLSDNPSTTEAMMSILTGDMDSSSVVDAYLNEAMTAVEAQNQTLIDNFQKLPDSAKAAIGLDPSQPVTIEALREIFGQDYGTTAGTTPEVEAPQTVVPEVSDGNSSSLNNGTNGNTSGNNSGSTYYQPQMNVDVIGGKEYYTTFVDMGTSLADEVSAESSLARLSLMNGGAVEPREFGEGPSEAFYATAGQASQLTVDGQVVTPRVLMQQVETPIVSKVHSIYVNNETSSDSEFMIKLTPEGLGEITVNMKNEGGKIYVSMFSENPLTNKLLNSQLDNIRQNMSLQDVNLEYLEVRAGSETFGGGMGQSFMQFGAGNQGQTNQQATNFSQAPDNIETDIENEGEAVVPPDGAARYV